MKDQQITQIQNIPKFDKQSNQNNIEYLDYLYNYSRRNKKYIYNNLQFKIYKQSVLCIYNNQPVGYVNVNKYLNGQEVSVVFVKKEYINKGIGKSLYQFVINKYKTLYSGDQQTIYSKRLWLSLFKSGKYNIVGCTPTKQYFKVGLSKSGKQLISLDNNYALYSTKGYTANFNKLVASVKGINYLNQGIIVNNLKQIIKQYIKQLNKEKVMKKPELKQIIKEQITQQELSQYKMLKYINTASEQGQPPQTTSVIQSQMLGVMILKSLFRQELVSSDLGKGGVQYVELTQLGKERLNKYNNTSKDIVFCKQLNYQVIMSSSLNDKIGHS